MFTMLPKSELAKEKASRLSPLLLAHLDMILTAGLLRPDLYCQRLDFFKEEISGSEYDFLVLAMSEMVIVLAFSQITDLMAIIDFHLLPSAFGDVGEDGPPPGCP